MPAARATSEATAPGSIAAVTIRSLSARGQRRRRCTDAITSTCVFVIGVALGLLLGLAVTAHSRKAVLTGCVQCFVLTGDLNGGLGGRIDAVRNPEGRTSNCCSATFVGKFWFSLN